MNFDPQSNDLKIHGSQGESGEGSSALKSAVGGRSAAENGAGSGSKAALGSKAAAEAASSSASAAPSPSTSEVDEHQLLVDRMLSEEAIIRCGGGDDAIARLHAKGRLTARERIAALVDPGRSFVELGLWAAWEM